MPMTAKWQKYQEINQNIAWTLHKKFGTRLVKKQHKGKRIDKLFNFSNKMQQNLIYLGEILVVGLFSFSTLIFGSGTSMVNNTSLVYPTDQVSRIECRTQEWSTLSEDCKIKLPIIKGANYAQFAQIPVYTDTYTVLFGGNYLSGWNMEGGSHYGLDLASSKGTPLYAIAQGKVYFAGQQAGYGNVVKIQFLYNGKMYFATYGHMDQILVQTGQPITKWQKIGTIGNSGTTMGGLWGYHVHFEINKGEFGRPVYPFAQCSEAKKSGIETINNGLCREEMFKYGIDPILFLESAKASLPHQESTPSIKNTDLAPDLWKKEEKSHGDLVLPTIANLDSSEHNAAKELPEKTPIALDLRSPKVELSQPSDSFVPEARQVVEFDSSNLDRIGKEFFEEWKLSLTGDLLSPIKKGETRNLKLTIVSKRTGLPYEWILKQPIILVANSTNISLDPVAITLVKNGEVEIKVNGHQAGATYTAINLGVNKVASMNLAVY